MEKISPNETKTCEAAAQSPHKKGFSLIRGGRPTAIKRAFHADDANENEKTNDTVHHTQHAAQAVGQIDCPTRSPTQDGSTEGRPDG